MDDLAIGGVLRELRLRLGWPQRVVAARAGISQAALKTELVDPGDLLAVTNRRKRLAAEIVEPFGWKARQVAQWVVLADSRTNRRRLAAVRAVMRAAFPSDGRAVPGWLRNPVGAPSALWFLPSSNGMRGGRGHAPSLRAGRASASAASHTDPA